MVSRDRSSTTKSKEARNKILARVNTKNSGKIYKSLIPTFGSYYRIRSNFRTTKFTKMTGLKAFRNNIFENQRKLN